MQTENERKQIGERLAKYRKMKDFSQTDFAKELNVSRPLVAAWEKGQREILPYLDDICRVLSVDSEKLLTGISSANQTVCDELGLSDLSVEQLKMFNQFTTHKYIPKLDFDEMFSGDVEITGFSPSECVQMLNILIEKPQGQILLSLLYRYCFVDFQQAYIDSNGINVPCDELFFNNTGDMEGRTTFNPSLFRYSILKGIENTLESLRYNINISNNLKGDI